MNISDYWPDEGEVSGWMKESTKTQWLWMWQLRQATWDGFASIEAEKGIVKPKVSLSTSYGQEVMRIILFRILEEASESLMATEEEHVKEELIDSVNYLMSVFLLDKQALTLNTLANLFDFLTTNRVEWGKPLTVEDLGTCSLLLSGTLSDKLRNRAWMRSAQDFHFSGRDTMRNTLLESAKLLLQPFQNLQEFMTYFVAKDRVLQFRLQSKY